MFENRPEMANGSYRTKSEAELVRLCLERDELAWHAFINRYRRLMYSIPWRYGFDPDDIKDVVQNVCIKLFKNLRAVGDVSKIPLWISTTTYRECRALAFKKRRYVLFQVESEEDELEGELDDDTGAPLDPSGTLEEMMSWAEKHEILHEVLETLQPPCGVLIRTLFFEDGSYEEAAARLGVSRQGIGPRRARCFEHLHAQLSERGITTA
ncbi:MAG TPA: sigma-70 family RNA polymerase sigma factor [Terriglobia bacterium]|nr:sigma-70 family RNA polymerase sigma factor [Terriglobia bacterium]